MRSGAGDNSRREFTAGFTVCSWLENRGWNTGASECSHGSSRIEKSPSLVVVFASVVVVPELGRWKVMRNVASVLRCWTLSDIFFSDCGERKGRKGKERGSKSGPGSVRSINQMIGELGLDDCTKGSQLSRCFNVEALYQAMDV